MVGLLLMLIMLGAPFIAVGIIMRMSSRKRAGFGSLPRALGAAFRVVELSSARAVVMTHRGDRTFTACASMGPGKTTWFVTSPRPRTKSPWEVGVRERDVQRCHDEIERAMVRMRIVSVEMVGGEITQGVPRGTSAVEIIDVFDVATEIAALIDRMMPSAVSLHVDEELFAHPRTPTEAVSGTSGAPFGIGPGER